jgi:hypothetical protein
MQLAYEPSKSNPSEKQVAGLQINKQRDLSYYSDTEIVYFGRLNRDIMDHGYDVLGVRGLPSLSATSVQPGQVTFGSVPEWLAIDVIIMLSHF